jgi:hypothetical protein
LSDHAFLGDVLAVLSMCSTALRSGTSLPQITPSPLVARFREGKFKGLDLPNDPSDSGEIPSLVTVEGGSLGLNLAEDEQCSNRRITCGTPSASPPPFLFFPDWTALLSSVKRERWGFAQALTAVSWARVITSRGFILSKSGLDRYVDSRHATLVRPCNE